MVSYTFGLAPCGTAEPVLPEDHLADLPLVVFAFRDITTLHLQNINAPPHTTTNKRYATAQRQVSAAMHKSSTRQIAKFQTI